ncbi:MAG: response regulator [Acidobacteriaceae bacterium]|nr:response regulator [Acidobacteriaceae bacterium]
MKARILVVEDDQIIQLDLRRNLKRLDYDVVGTASSGEEAITKAAQLQPDLVLIDIRLQGAMDGIEAARQIQLARDVPVIYLTAQSVDLIPGSKEALGPRVTKPFKQTELQATIESTLQSKRA